MQHEMQHEYDTIYAPQCSAGEIFLKKKSTPKDAKLQIQTKVW